MDLEPRHAPMITKTLLYFASGAVFATALMLSCSDDSPKAADAATCDCPASEPPLASRITRPKMTGTIAANASDLVSVACPANAKILGGACIALQGSAPDVTLQQAGFDDGENGW